MDLVTKDSYETIMEVWRGDSGVARRRIAGFHVIPSTSQCCSSSHVERLLAYARPTLHDASPRREYVVSSAHGVEPSLHQALLEA